MVASIIMNNSSVPFDHHEERMLVSYAFKAVFSVAVSTIALLSVSGNVLAVISFVKTQNLRTSTNYYITSMAVSDLASYVATQWSLIVRGRHSVLDRQFLSFNVDSGYTSQLFLIQFLLRALC